MKGLSLKVDADYSGTRAFTEGRGRTVAATSAPPRSPCPTGTLVLENSCLSNGTGKCTAEDGQFHPAGVLTLPEGVTRLFLAKGVVLDPSDDPEVPLAVPQVLIWTSIGQLLWVVLVALLLGMALRRFSPGRVGRCREHYARDENWLEEVPERDRDRCVGARTNAALAHRAETLLDVVGAITSPVALVVVVDLECGRPAVGDAGLRLDAHRRDRVDVARGRHVGRADRPRVADPPLREGPQGDRRDLGPDHVLAPGGAPAGAALLRRARDPRAPDPLALGARPGARRVLRAQPADPVGPQPGLADRAVDGEPARRGPAGADAGDHLRQPDPGALRAHLPAGLRGGRRRLRGRPPGSRPSTTRPPTCRALDGSSGPAAIPAIPPGDGPRAGSTAPAASGSTCSVVRTPWAGASSPTSTASSTGRSPEVPPGASATPGRR